MRLFILGLISLVSFGMPAISRAADCPFNAGGPSDWGPITSATTACGTETGADTFIVGDQEDVSGVADLTWTSDVCSLIIETGGRFSVDVPSVGDAVQLYLCDGIDDVGEDLHDDVALYEEPGGVIDLQGGFLTRSAASPALVDTLVGSTDAVWEVAAFSLCGDGDDDSPFATGTCSGGNQNLFSIVYTVSENDPAAGSGTGAENHLAASISAIEDDFEVCPLSGMDRNHCYQVDSHDEDLVGDDQLGITVDTHQLSHAYDLDCAAFPLADREMRRAAIADDLDGIPAGATCVETEASVISASGQLAGSCAYFFDASGGNGWRRPLRVERTEDSMTCDGTGGGAGDAFHFALETPLPADLVDNAVVVFSPLCIGSGDRFSVVAPVDLTVNTGRDDGEGKIILMGSVSLDAVFVSGSGLILFDGATADLGVVHIRAGGVAGGPAVKFLDMRQLRLDYFSVVGGPESGAATGIELSGIREAPSLSHGRVRYYGGWAFFQSGADMGIARLQDFGCERIGHAVAAVGTGCIQNVTLAGGVFVDTLLATDPTHGSTGDLVAAPSGYPIVVNGLSLHGQTEGGIARVPGALTAYLYNGLVRGGVSTRTGATTYLPAYVAYGDFELRCATCASSFNYPIGITEGTVFRRSITANDEIVRIMAGGVLRNSKFISSDTTDMTDTAVVRVTIDNNPATVPTIENVTIEWEDGEETAFTYAIADSNGAANQETELRLGGISVFNHHGADSDEDYVSIRFVPDAVSVVNSRAGALCVYGGSVASGGGGSYAEISNLASYDAAGAQVELGRAPEWIDSSEAVLDPKGLAARWRCSALSGSDAAGVRPGQDSLYEFFGAVPPERPRLLD